MSSNMQCRSKESCFLLDLSQNKYATQPGGKNVVAGEQQMDLVVYTKAHEIVWYKLFHYTVSRMVISLVPTLQKISCLYNLYLHEANLNKCHSQVEFLWGHCFQRCYKQLSQLFLWSREKDRAKPCYRAQHDGAEELKSWRNVTNAG